MKLVSKIITKYKNIKVGIAVSGGADSMCLLNLFLKEKIDTSNLVVINFDHCLRGAESESDSQFVSQFCSEHNLPLYFKKLDIPSFANSTKKSEETIARECRQAEYARLIESGAVDKIFLAHNLDDHTESVLMHIFRGCGISGLIGPSELDGYIVRPLISVSKRDIVRYNQSHGVEYVTDSSNAVNDYDRNYVRNVLLPLVRERWRGVDNSVAKLSAIASDTLSQLSQMSDDKVKSDGKSVVVPWAWLNANVVISGINRLGIYADIEKKHIDSILNMDSVQMGGSINLPNKLIAMREYDGVRLYVDKQSKGEMCTLSYVRVAPVPVSGKLIIDYDKLPDNVVVRKRQSGDKFKACNQRTKLLSDYLIDKKVPLYTRDLLWVLADGNDILAVQGMGIGNKLKLCGDTVDAREIIFGVEYEEKL